MSRSPGRLAGRVAIVTGAGSGLGAATVQRFADEDATVLCVDIDGDAAARTADALHRTGATTASMAADVTRQTDLEAAAAAALEMGGRIDVLFANAGIAGAGTALTTTTEQWSQVLAVNLTGVWLSCRAVLPAMVSQRSGSIVCTASTAGLVGVANIASYAAAKGGVVALVRQMAADFSGDGIRINAICPGTVPTPLVRRSYETGGGVGVGGDVESRLRDAATRYPLGRVGTTADIAALATFLASDESSWITGVALPVDGGYTAL